MSVRMIAVVLSLLVGGAAHAADGDGLSVGLWTAGGELTGALAGGGVGLMMGVEACDAADSFECYLPIITTPLGATVGAFGGSALASTLSARGRGVDARRVRRWTLATGAAGFGIAALGGVVDSGGVMATGAVVSLVGMPVAAGLAARDRSSASADEPRRPSVVFSPSAGPGRLSLSVAGAF